MENLTRESVEKEADSRFPETPLAPENNRRADDFIAGAMWALAQAGCPRKAES